MDAAKKWISAEELRRHNKSGDLWISIQGKVYDVSQWAKVHPGGETSLVTLAGQDVTDAFIAFHPGSAWRQLEGLFTGYYLEDFKVSEMSKDYRSLMNELSRSGVFDKKGHHVLWSFVCIAIMMFCCVYGVISSESGVVHMLCAAVLGLLWIQSAYVGHDSGHYQVKLLKIYLLDSQLTFIYLLQKFDPFLSFFLYYIYLCRPIYYTYGWCRSSFSNLRGETYMSSMGQNYMD